MVIAVATRSAQNVRDEGETSLSIGSFLDGLVDLGLRGRLGTLLLGRLVAFAPELLSDLVGVEGTRLLSVRLVDVILRRRWDDTEDIVEGRGGIGLVGRNLVADAEDLTV